MGSYSQLHIGKYSFSWKYHVPSFVLFLFEETDFYLVPRDSGEPPLEIGWRTTAETALKRINQAGYGKNFFAMVFDTLRHDLENDYEESLKYHLSEKMDANEVGDIDGEVHRRFTEHVNQFPRILSTKIATDFVKFVSAAKEASGNSNQLGRSSSFQAEDGKEYFLNPTAFELNDSVLTYPDTIAGFLLDRQLEYPPWVIMASSMMEFDEGLDHAEVIFLMMFWVMLEASVPEATVCLDLADLGYTQAEIRLLPQRMRFELARKVSLYNAAFRVLMDNEQKVREDFIKLECANILEQSRYLSDNNAKGRALENAAELLFSIEPGLKLQGKRVNTGDEEIDLVYRNNVNRPFWFNFKSPLIFVECKNWSQPVGAPEIRDFAMKLMNHMGANIGIMISGSFTSKVDDTLSRLSREAYHIALITVDDILQFCRGDQTFYDWVEQKIATVH